MKVCMLLFCLFLFLPPCAAHEFNYNKESVFHVVNYFGLLMEHGDANLLLPIIAKTPDLFIPELIRQLETTDEKMVTPSEKNVKLEAQNNIWRIRALRYLTCGLDFSATTTYRPTKEDVQGDYRYWVAGSRASSEPDAPPAEVWYFHTWMSRDIAYIAPRDAQEEIVRKWKHWLPTNGTITGCTPVMDYNEWYF